MRPPSRSTNLGERRHGDLGGVSCGSRVDPQDSVTLTNGSNGGNAPERTQQSAISVGEAKRKPQASQPEHWPRVVASSAGRPGDRPVSQNKRWPAVYKASDGAPGESNRRKMERVISSTTELGVVTRRRRNPVEERSAYNVVLLGVVYRSR